jgi:isopentenyl-diphosphate delta-isomerase type 1
MSDVILVDEQNNPIGQTDKYEAHLKGLPHRAFSIFVFKKTPQGLSLLLQKRALSKYHSAGLWSNTCCSHPKPLENLKIAAENRLFFEMGLKISLTDVGLFHYQAKLNNGLVENEWDYLFTGFYNNEVIQPNLAEVDCYRFEHLHVLQKNLHVHPQRYTAWLPLALKKVIPFV